MRGRTIGAALVAACGMFSAGVVISAGPLLAQQRQSIAPTIQPDPNLNKEDQFAPSQIAQPVPSAVDEPRSASGHKSVRPARHAAVSPAAEPAPPKPPRSAAISRTVVACSGPFAKDSGMLGLAMAFNSRNVVFTQVDAGGSKIGASVLFPKDPKRRLEVWWANPNRTGTYLIVINGKSAWSGPGGVRLGLTLEELEKLNHKPFKLKGFGKDDVATVSDWDGGALATLAGGCKAGLSMHADPKAPATVVSAVTADHEVSSADPEIRAAKPRVSEILIGY